jgi:hypothetical protein
MAQKITIEIPQDSLIDANVIKNALEKIAKNASKENIKCMAELAEKPNFNNAFASNFNLLKSML